MISGRFEGLRRRPFITAHLSIPSHNIAGEVSFLVDTGADSIVLAPTDALFLGIDTKALAPGAATTGVGGRTPTVQTDATITLNNRAFQVLLHILAPQSRQQQQALSTIPSLLGRDLLARFALFLEERTHRVLLLDPQEAEALKLP
jgi:predicted aspartyl protease